jgi:hypothetical protein
MLVENRPVITKAGYRGRLFGSARAKRGAARVLVARRKCGPSGT